MRFRNLDLNQLVCLDALLTERSVSRAAERLFLSQSATSNSLTRLRAYFGDELLVQVGRKMLLSPLGNELLQPVRDVLLQIQTITSIERNFNIAESDRTVSVVASDYVSTVFMAEVIRRVARQAPKMTIKMRQLDYKWSMLLERGEVDMIVMPAEFKLPDYPAEELFSDTWVCVMWDQNPHVGESISFAQYTGLGHVIVDYSDVRTVTFDEWFMKTYKHTRKVEATTPYFNVLPHLLVGTNRIATVQVQLMKVFEQLLPLKSVRLPFDMPVFTEVLQYPTYLELDPAITWLRGVMKAVADDMVSGVDRTMAPMARKG
ncbi:MAG: LysR family transcriptional regulator [Pseudomonadota bacterium]